MSYDIGLYQNGKPVKINRHSEGGVYPLGGTTQAELNVTYNYSSYYHKHLDNEKGFRWLYGKAGAETIERLEEAIAVLGTERDSNYWKSTPGNAGYALSILLRWAREYPQAIFRGD